MLMAHRRVKADKAEKHVRPSRSTASKGPVCAPAQTPAKDEHIIHSIHGLTVQPVMPGMLNGKSASEYHPPHPRPQAAHQSSRSAIGTGPRGDDPPRSHPMIVPPSMAPMAVSGGIDDVQGPRHSALGLEGIEAQSGGANAFGQGYSDDPAHAAHPAYGGFGGFSGPEREQEGAVGRLSSLLGLRKAPTVRQKRPTWYV